MSTVEKAEKNVVEFEFSVSGEEFRAAIEKAYKKNVGKINIQGFRRGKAPRQIIERYYGSEIFFEDAVNIVLPDAYDKAIDEQNIEAVAQPEIDVKSISREDGVVFTAKVTVKPDFELGEYKGVEASKITYRTTEKEIKGEIEKIRERNARMVNVEDRTAKLDDTVNIDFEGFTDGVAFEGGKGENFDLKLGSGQFIPGFEEQLVGKKAGDEVDVNVTFPEDYHAADLAGKAAVFKVKVNEVKRNELPVLDDEFVKDVSEFSTLDEYKVDIKAKIQARKEREAEIAFENALHDIIIENVEGEIPDCMFESEVDNILKEYEYNMKYQGIDLNMYLQYTGQTMEQLRESVKPRAIKGVKRSLALEYIAKAENIIPTAEDFDKEYSALSEEYKMKVEDIKERLPESAIADQITYRKAFEFVKENAVSE